jgi:hypothetical protein
MFDKAEMIEKLKLELDVLEKGGYAPSDWEPHWMPRVFRDSVSCPNLGLDIKVEPCSNCYLMHFVPPEHRDKENPCHHIPLNPRGDTVASLSREENKEALLTALRSWLQSTIAKLEERAPSSSEFLLASGDRSSKQP